MKIVTTDAEMFASVIRGIGRSREAIVFQLQDGSVLEITAHS